MKMRLVLLLLLLLQGCSASQDEDLTGDLEAVAAEDAAANVENQADSPGNTELDNNETDGPRVLTPDVLALFEIIPQRGVVEGGDSITLSGNGFKPGVKVSFDGVAAGPSIYLDHTLISVIAPPGDEGLVSVKVENPEGDSVTVENAFRYYVPFGIESVYPSAGPIQGGTAITVEGFGFPEDVVVLVGGRKAINVEQASDTTLIAISPPGSEAGPTDVHVWTEAGTTVLENGFTYEEALSLEELVPPVGHSDGSEYVLVKGEGLSETVRAFFGEIEASTQFADGELSVLTPAHPVGPVEFRIETSNGEESDALPFYYVNEEFASGPLAVHAVLPGKGTSSGGSLVTVVASGIDDATTTSVSFGGKGAELTAIDPEQGFLEVITPTGTPGYVDVAVSVLGEETSLVNGYLYEDALSLEQVIPDVGPAEGGIEVRLVGEGLDSVDGVWFGPLPATNLEMDEDSLIATIPPGSEGAVTVWLERGNDLEPFPGLFEYESEAMMLYAVTPPDGPQGGNTTVTLFGTGLPEQGTVRFGKNMASHYTWLGSTSVEVRVPPATQPGPVDVEIEDLNGEASALLGGYSYINPESGWGGTWGGVVDGVLNVTVKDVWLDEGIEDAFVVVDTGTTEGNQGYTNWLGQISFSGPNIDGAQMITAWKEGYSASSIVEFDAENATVLLFPEQPTSSSSGGGGGQESPFSQLGTIEGKVIFNEKYLAPPPGNCPDQPLDPNSILCGPCETDAQCGDEGDLCTTMPSGTQHCTTACETGEECPSGYACIAVSLEEVKQCMPISGTIQIRCETTRASSFTTNPQPGAGSIADPVTGEFTIQARTGEMGVVCTGELIDPVTGEGTPQAMGANWPIQVNKGEKTVGIEVELDVPLNRDITMSIGYPPSKLIELPHHRFRALLQFGDLQEYGVHEMQRLSLIPGDSTVELGNLPEGLFGSLDGTGWLLMGGAYSDASTFVQWFPPFSTAVRRNLPGLASSHLFIQQSGGWSPVSIPLTPLADTWGWNGGETWAVGEDNQIYIYDGDAWSVAKTPIDASWVGVWGTDEENVYVAGAEGDVAVWMESQWVSVGSVESTVHGIGGVDSPVVVGDNGGVWLREEEAWVALETNTEATLNGVWGAPDINIVWAVGNDGTILRIEEGVAAVESSGTEAHLYGVTGTDDGQTVYACGEGGTILKRTGSGEWNPLPTTTLNTLFDAWLSTSGDLTVVGQMGTILLVTGEEGSILDQSLENSGAILKSVWGTGETPKWIAGKDALFFGPLMEIPKFESPAMEGAVLGSKIAWTPVAGAFPSFTFVEVGSPWWKPIWQMVVAGTEFSVNVPDLKALSGDGPTGQNALLKATRVIQNGFSMESFNYFDVFYEFMWDSWSTNTSSISLF